MTKIAQVGQELDDTLRIPCMCGGDGHMLIFSADLETFRDEDEVWLSVQDSYMTPRGWAGRIRGALWLFFKGEYCRGEAGLNAEKLLEIQAWCQKYLEMGGHVSESTGAKVSRTEADT